MGQSKMKIAKTLAIYGLSGVLAGNISSHEVQKRTSELKQYVTSKQFSASALEQVSLESHLDEAYKRDQETVDYIKTSARSSYNTWLPNQGRQTCNKLHWTLCHNMSVEEANLDVDFQDIRGNKMIQFMEFENDLKLRKDRIIKDLEGKTYDISILEGQTKSDQADLEKLEDAFIIQLKHDYEVATKINDDLHATKDSFGDIAAQFTKLTREIKNAHVDCEDQAPCMAVPTCKIGTATGKSCADIVNSNMDKDASGDDKNHALSGYYLIQPKPDLPPKPTICRNDILGGAFTVVQNRFDGSENFDRNWADYKNGFGQAADFNSPACDEGEFWLGNEYPFNIQEDKNALIVDMKRVTGQTALVQYGNFEIGNERSGYQLRAADEFKDDDCGAKAGNSLAGSNFGDQGYGKADIRKTSHVGMKFTTKDRDQDKARANCAKQDRSGWWFNNCSAANLNGIFHGGKYSQKDTATGEFDDGILWNTWTQDKWEALIKTQMAVGQDKGAMLSVCDGNVGAGMDNAGDYTTDYESGYDYSYN